MNLIDVQKTVDTYSSAASKITRQLAFSGLAIIWVFKTDGGQGYAVADGLFTAGFLIILSLTMDFAQYVYGSIAWHSLHVYKEHEKVDTDVDFLAPTYFNLPTFIFFYCKLLLMIISYIYILKYLAKILTSST